MPIFSTESTQPSFLVTFLENPLSANITCEWWFISGQPLRRGRRHLLPHRSPGALQCLRHWPREQILLWRDTGMVNFRKSTQVVILDLTRRLKCHLFCCEIMTWNPFHPNSWRCRPYSTATSSQSTAWPRPGGSSPRLWGSSPTAASSCRWPKEGTILQES